jgi:hypothetical protein
MFLVNGIKAKLIQNNRNDSQVYDDEDRKIINIKICPYDVENSIKFGINTIPEATGYFQVQRWVDVKEGDQIIFKDKTYTILKVEENWIYNRIENKVLVVK